MICIFNLHAGMFRYIYKMKFIIHQRDGYVRKEALRSARWKMFGTHGGGSLIARQNIHNGRMKFRRVVSSIRALHSLDTIPGIT